MRVIVSCRLAIACFCVVPRHANLGECLDAGAARAHRPAGGRFLCGDPHLGHSREALAVPAAPDRADAVSNRLSRRRSSGSRRSGAAGARRRRAAAVSAGAPGGAQHVRDVRDDRHGARARPDRGAALLAFYVWGCSSTRTCRRPPSPESRCRRHLAEAVAIVLMARDVGPGDASRADRPARLAAARVCQGRGRSLRQAARGFQQWLRSAIVREPRAWLLALSLVVSALAGDRRGSMAR